MNVKFNMNARFIIFTFLFSIIFVKLGFGANNIISCGVNQACEPGYYCSGAVGQSDSGVCVANAITTATCRFTSFVQSDIIKYIGLFAASFAGIYLFVGKFALVTFAQIIIGIGILFGAQKLVIQITGSSKGLCTSSDALACLANVSDVNKTLKTKRILNLDNQTKDPFTGKNCNFLECERMECDSYQLQTVGTGIGATTKCEKGPKKIVFTTKQAGDFTPTGCQANFTIKCEPTASGSFDRDYFTCKNNCVQDPTKNTFATEVPSSWNIKNCKELILKQISYEK
jgi:hypothetical protein